MSQRKDYAKIDIYINGEYFLSTKQHKACKDAVKAFRRRYNALSAGAKITAYKAN